jgi:hypothetical protein
MIGTRELFGLRTSRFHPDCRITLGCTKRDTIAPMALQLASANDNHFASAAAISEGFAWSFRKVKLVARRS